MGADNLQFMTWEFIMHLQIICLVILWKENQNSEGRKVRTSQNILGKFYSDY